jgi:hypothetical protein
MTRGQEDKRTRGQEDKKKISNNRHQITNKFQNPNYNSEHSLLVWNLMIEF